MPRRTKSFFDLAFGVDPGGARKDAHFIRGSLDEIKADLASELDDQLNLYLLCWYGATLELRVYERGELTRAVDLHPLVTIEIPGYPTITFDGPGKPNGHDFRAEDDDEEGLTAQLFDGSAEGVKVSVDWTRLDVPALPGEIVRDGDFVNIDGDWLPDDDELDGDELVDNGYLPYGLTDREA